MGSEYIVLGAVNSLRKVAYFIMATFAFCVLAVCVLLYVKSDDTPALPKSNEDIARQMFESRGYKPTSIIVNTVENGTYCGELTNGGMDSVWFKVDERGINIFQNGTVYYSQNSTQFTPVIEKLSLGTFQQYCELRTERNPYDAQYENL